MYLLLVFPFDPMIPFSSLQEDKILVSPCAVSHDFTACFIQGAEQERETTAVTLSAHSHLTQE